MNHDTARHIFRTLQTTVILLRHRFRLETSFPVESCVVFRGHSFRQSRERASVSFKRRFQVKQKRRRYQPLRHKKQLARKTRSFRGIRVVLSIMRCPWGSKPSTVQASFHGRTGCAQPRRCTAQSSLQEQLQSWLELDTDPESVAEVTELQAANDPSLPDRFGCRLAFGACSLTMLPHIRVKSMCMRATCFSICRLDGGWKQPVP